MPSIDDAILSEVKSAVLARGSLTKREVLESWGLADDEYTELKKLVLKDAALEGGPQKIGGFIARKSRSAKTAESDGDAFLLRDGWETETVARLAELLQHGDLEELLGDLLQTVRQVRRAETGVDRRGSKVELATALVLQHGIDLFANGDVRRSVGRAAKEKAPDRWFPGKPAAVEFVARIRFPRELAGLVAEERPPDYERLEGRFALRGLWPFQLEVKTALDMTLQAVGERALLTLPTGAGKTRVAVESLRDWLTCIHNQTTRSAVRSTVLWLAHTEELCEQAYACFKQVWDASDNVCPLLLFRFWGRYTQDLAKHRGVLQQALSQPAVLVSTPQRMTNLLDGHIEDGAAIVKDLQQSLGVLLVDEAHRAAAPSYQRVVSGVVTEERPVAVIGLTATPYRMEYVGSDPEEGTRELREVFHRLIEPTGTLGDNPRARLQEMGVLARPVLEMVATHTKVRLSSVPPGTNLSDEQVERIDRELALKTDNSARRLAVFKHILPIAQNEANSLLYFGPSVRDAECMAYLLRRERVPAAVVSGVTREATRRQVVADFKQKKLRVLCNCEVLTTGFDAPLVTHVVVARPTVSRVLYEQIVGRGLRGKEFGGTESCVILNCRDDVAGGIPELGYEAFRRVWTGVRT